MIRFIIISMALKKLFNLFHGFLTYQNSDGTLYLQLRVLWNSNGDSNSVIVIADHFIDVYSVENGSAQVCNCSQHKSTSHQLGSIFSLHDRLQQPWPSSNTLNSDQHGPGFKAHRRPLVMSGRASGLKCLCQN